MRFTKRSAACMAAMLSMSMMSGMTVSAADKTYTIDMSDENKADAWANVAMTNDDTVSTGIMIRSAASGESDAVGYLYRGGAVTVLNKGEEWTEVESGGIQGYIKNEYLVYGDEAKGLAEYYGKYGVAAKWNDVNVFADDDAASQVVKEAQDGNTFEYVSNQGHWIEVKNGEDTAYVSAEDVKNVIMVGAAVSLNEDGSAAQADYAADSASVDYTDYSASADYSAESTSADYSDYSTDSASVDYSDYSASADTTDYSASADYSADSTSTDYTDYSASETTADYSETYTEETAAAQTEAQVQTEAAQTEAPAQTEAAKTSTASSSETDLLAAIIYCEAGNQPYDGMVAVGAVVMNRVNSSSFPNTISEVIYQSGQFYPAGSGTLSSALANGVPSACYSAAADALAGSDPTGGKLYFNTSHGSGVHIGAHWFY